MGFMYFDLTPHLYIIFNMLLASHFDAIPLKDYLTEITRQSDRTEVFESYTENMGVFEYETSLIYINLTDAVLVIALMTLLYLLLRAAKLI